MARLEWLLAMRDANMHDLIEWGGVILLSLVSYGIYYFRAEGLRQKETAMATPIEWVILLSVVTYGFYYFRKKDCP